MSDRQWRALRLALTSQLDKETFESFWTKNFRIFFNAKRWIDNISSYPFALGMRIHGNMAALAAGRPGGLVTHDSRVTELAEEMRIPTVDADVLRFSNCVGDILNRVKFDADSFDSSRRMKASQLIDELSKLGIPTSHHLKLIVA